MTSMDPRPEGLNTEKAPESIVEMLVTPYALIKELTDDLESELMDRYRGYPEDNRRFVRDMFLVKQARAFLDMPQKPDGWIPITEKTPESHQEVIIFADGCVLLASRIGEEFYTLTDGSPLEPTHWMPLPAAPTDEVKNA